MNLFWLLKPASPMEIKQTKMAFMLIYLYCNNELFFLSGTVLCYKNCLHLEKKKQKNKDKNMGKAKKGKLFGFLKSKKSLGLQM